MKASQREEAVQLRIREQMGYGEIAKRVKVSKRTLSRWLRDLPLSDERLLELRRSAWGKGEAKREQFRRTMRAKRDAWEVSIYEGQKKKFKKIPNQTYFVAGLMLYAAEGDKKTQAEIAFSNTDPIMVLFFARWLGEFLDIPLSRLRIQLHMYENMDKEKEEEYWRATLGMKREQLCKTQVKPLRVGAYSYPEPYRRASCKLYVGGVLKKAELMQSIKAFFDVSSQNLTKS